MNDEVGRGGGGHGGHGGARGGFGFVTADPWVYDPDFLEEHRRAQAHVTGQELLSTGEGAIVVLALLWYLVHEADKRVPR